MKESFVLWEINTDRHNRVWVKRVLSEVSRQQSFWIAFDLSCASLLVLPCLPVWLKYHIQRALNYCNPSHLELERDIRPVCYDRQRSCVSEKCHRRRLQKDNHVHRMFRSVFLFSFSCVLLMFSCSWDQRSAELFGHSPRHVFVGVLDLRVGSAGVGELFSWVGIVQIPPHPRHFRWDVVVAILLSDNLEETGKQELMS